MAVNGCCENCGEVSHLGGNGYCECECHIGIELAKRLRTLQVVAWTDDGHTFLTAEDWRERGVDPEEEGFSPVYMRTVH